MTLQENIPALMDRIARAESERDTLRALGQNAQYHEARSTVEELERQLDIRLQ